jgi:hypothetical protein
MLRLDCTLIFGAVYGIYGCTKVRIFHVRFETNAFSDRSAWSIWPNNGLPTGARSKASTVRLPVMVAPLTYMTVNALNVGPTNTDLSAGLPADPVWQRLRAKPEQVGELMSFLVSDKSEWINASTVNGNGGYQPIT